MQIVIDLKIANRRVDFTSAKVDQSRPLVVVKCDHSCLRSGYIIYPEG